MERNEITEEVTEKAEEANVTGKKKIFVAGATGSTGKKIVEQLLAKGYSVKAGVRDINKAKTTLSNGNPALQIVSFIPFLLKYGNYIRPENSISSLSYFLVLWWDY